MANVLIPNSLRGYRDLIKGRVSASEDQLTANFSAIRAYLRNRQPPFRGERVRKSTLGLIGILTLLLSVYCMLATS